MYAFRRSCFISRSRFFSGGTVLSGSVNDVSGREAVVVEDLESLKAKLANSEQEADELANQRAHLLRNCMARRVWLSFDTNDGTVYEFLILLIFWHFNVIIIL